MNTSKNRIEFSMVIGIILSACGPSNAKIIATTTQVAANINATQTANAPTMTMTLIPTQTSTVKPTETATATLSPTSTSTFTPTPSPPLMSLAITLDDLPEGFITMPDEELRDVQDNLPDDAIVFAFTNEEELNLVMGQLIPYTTRVEQNAFDAMLPEMMDVFAAAFGAETTPEPILGLDKLGDSWASTTFLNDFFIIETRWEIVVFRRGEIALILYTVHPEGNEPVLDVIEIASLMDDRLSELLGIHY